MFTAGEGIEKFDAYKAHTLGLRIFGLIGELYRAELNSGKGAEPHHAAEIYAGLAYVAGKMLAAGNGLEQEDGWGEAFFLNVLFEMRARTSADILEHGPEYIAKFKARKWPN